MGRARGGHGEGVAGVHCVSARMQTLPKFVLEIGPNGQENRHPSVCVSALGRVFCLRGSKRNWTDEMGWRVGVALRNRDTVSPLLVACWEE